MFKFKKKFDKKCSKWVDNYDINKLTLEVIMSYFTKMLKSQGYVFLRDIYTELGIPITQESCVFGWDKENSKDVGIMMKIRQIEGSPNFELEFKCYPILEGLVTEAKAS